MMLITTLFVSFLVCCMLEVRCGWAGVVSGLQVSCWRFILQEILSSNWNDIENHFKTFTEQ